MYIEAYTLDTEQPICYGVYIMNANLLRTQVYLNGEDISLLDELARQIRVSRSQIIRDATKAVAYQYAKLVQLTLGKSQGTNPLKDLIGLEESRTGRVGFSVDDQYHHD